MKKLFILLLLSLLLSGCASEQYYIKPESKGYTVEHFGALCSNCNRAFKFSKAEFDDCRGKAKCPYCGAENDLIQANNRFNYEQQAQQQANWQRCGQALIQGGQAMQGN